jgi:hypothetical protein
MDISNMAFNATFDSSDKYIPLNGVLNIGSPLTQFNSKQHDRKGYYFIEKI